MPSGWSSMAHPRTQKGTFAFKGRVSSGRQSGPPSYRRFNGRGVSGGFQLPRRPSTRLSGGGYAPSGMPHGRLSGPPQMRSGHMSGRPGLGHRMNKSMWGLPRGKKLW